MRNSDHSWILPVAFALVIGAISVSVEAVDGISVSAHWTGESGARIGGFGQIWRHEILSSVVVSHELIYSDPSNPARMPVISPDGSRVAFLTKDGSLVVTRLDTPEQEFEVVAISHPEACLDWPRDNWLYYNMGGFEQPTGSGILRRVDVYSKTDELVAEFFRDDGISPGGVWRFHLSRDLDRILVRPDNTPPEPWGRLVAHELNPGVNTLTMSRSTDRFSCSGGIDPEGVYFADGHQDHKGVEIRFWKDKSVVDSVRWNEPQLLENEPREMGDHHNLNSWSTNSTDWICLHMGWTKDGSNFPNVAANQVLLNWRNFQRIIVTQNLETSTAYDCSGDFWVDYGTDKADTLPPSLRSVNATGEDGVSVVFSENLSRASAESPPNYRIEPPVKILSATLLEPSNMVLLSTQTLEKSVEYILMVTGLEDRASPPNAMIAEERMPFIFEDRLQVSAGSDRNAVVEQQVFLPGEIEYKNYMDCELEVLWSVLAGPADVFFENDKVASTYARFDEPGEYVLQLHVKACGLKESDAVSVIVSAAPWIDLISPSGGEHWNGGSTEEIRWRTSGVHDVRIDFSADDGQTWSNVEMTIDEASNSWGEYSWTVPEVETQGAIIKLEEYSALTSVTSARFTVTPQEEILVNLVAIEARLPPKWRGVSEVHVGDNSVSVSEEGSFTVFVEEELLGTSFIRLPVVAHYNGLKLSRIIEIAISK